jgi:hypothetical protein
MRRNCMIYALETSKQGTQTVQDGKLSVETCMAGDDYMA